MIRCLHREDVIPRANSMTIKSLHIKMNIHTHMTSSIKKTGCKFNIRLYIIMQHCVKIYKGR